MPTVYAHSRIIYVYIRCKKTYQFKTQCIKGDITHAFETAKITVQCLTPWGAKLPDAPLQNELLY